MKSKDVIQGQDMKKTNIAKLKQVVVLALISVFFNSLLAEELTARQIVERYDSRNDGRTLEQDILMVLIDKDGKKRIRKIKSYEKKFGLDEYRAMYFKSPTDIKNTAFLTYDYKDKNKEEKQWLYLPAIKKVKRIPSGNKSSSFMGSDFSYFDMTNRDLDEYTYTILKETSVRGHKVWVIKAISKSEEEIKKSGYVKSILLIRQDNYVGVRGIFSMKNNKTKFLDVKEMHLQDGIWVYDKVSMTTKKGRDTIHSTLLINSNIRLNAPIKDAIFTVKRLEKGI